MLVHPEESTMPRLLSRSRNVPTHFPGNPSNSRPGSGSLNFIFMDIEMPVMNGLDAVREIRRREKKEGREPTFICATTAYVRPGDREKCLAAGMDAYLAKPIGMEALAGVIKSRETTERRVL
jgi:CheY-like chemotaxis protein